jgi:hypothetical protein
MYQLLDIFFVILHSAVILFNLFGWIWKKLRKANLALLMLTGCSWLFLGMIVGAPGYCPLTDWHFRVLAKLGYSDLPESYIKYLADRLTGLDFSSRLVDTVTLCAFLTALVVSVILNIRDYKNSRKA